jgi:hypothetical protein
VADERSAQRCPRDELIAGEIQLPAPDLRPMLFLHRLKGTRRG